MTKGYQTENELLSKILEELEKSRSRSDQRWKEVQAHMNLMMLDSGFKDGADEVARRLDARMRRHGFCVLGMFGIMIVVLTFSACAG